MSNPLSCLHQNVLANITNTTLLPQDTTLCGTYDVHGGDSLLHHVVPIYCS